MVSRAKHGKAEKKNFRWKFWALKLWAFTAPDLINMGSLSRLMIQKRPWKHLHRNGHGGCFSMANLYSLSSFRFDQRKLAVIPRFGIAHAAVNAIPTINSVHPNLRFTVRSLNLHYCNCTRFPVKKGTKVEKRHLERPYDACSEFEVKESREIMHISDFARKARHKLTHKKRYHKQFQSIPNRWLQKSHARPRRELTAPHIKKLTLYQLYTTINSKHQKLKWQIQKITSIIINHY